MKNLNPICPKCGKDKTLNAVGQLICRGCMRANGVGNSARATATRKARNDGGWITKGAPVDKGPTAFEVFDAMCDMHGIGATLPQMHPNAGRLKAGECLYPRRAEAA